MKLPDITKTIHYQIAIKEAARGLYLKWKEKNKIKENKMVYKITPEPKFKIGDKVHHVIEPYAKAVVMAYVVEKNNLAYMINHFTKDGTVRNSIIEEMLLVAWKQEGKQDGQA